MTTFDFQPSALAPFQFQPTLDGAVYTCIVTWNIVGQRYYIACYTLGNALVFYLPMVGSPLNYNINLAAGYFTKSSLVWRIQNGQFEVTP